MSFWSARIFPGNWRSETPRPISEQHAAEAALDVVEGVSGVSGFS
jgi:hypothetical protein